MKDFQFDNYLDTELLTGGTAIVSYITKPDTIFNKFSNIVYDKVSTYCQLLKCIRLYHYMLSQAAHLLLMLEDIIGEEKFKEAIRKYLKKYAYKTVTTNNFIATVEEVVPGISIRSFMESYLYQERFPLITVEETTAGTYILRQQMIKTSNESESEKRCVDFLTDLF